MDVLVTDKTGTLTEGRISFTGALDPPARTSDGDLLRSGLLATEADYAEARRRRRAEPAGRRALGVAGGAAASTRPRFERLDAARLRPRAAPMTSRARPATAGGPRGWSPRAPRRPSWPAARRRRPAAAGACWTSSSPPATGWSPSPPGRAAGLSALTPADERDLTLAGFLVFLDRPKAAAAASLQRLAALGITVKIATGDNADGRREGLRRPRAGRPAAR